MQKTNSLNSRIDKAIFEYKLLEDGDKILIGASGGKDSTALIEYFSNRKNAKTPILILIKSISRTHFS